MPPPDVRSVAELSEVPDPAWPALLEAVARADVPVTTLAVDPVRAARVLHSLQVSTGSALGALALHSGGLLVDHGWLRILGGGAEGLPDLAEANDLGDPADTLVRPSSLVVAFDVLGGQFAIDGGGLGVGPGEVCYRGPDTLRWFGLGTGHGSFVFAALGGALGDFYTELRWPGWQEEVAALGPGLGLLLYPPPFAQDGADLAAATRTPVPFAQLRGFYDDVAIQLSAVPDGPPPDGPPPDGRPPDGAR